MALAQRGVLLGAPGEAVEAALDQAQHRAVALGAELEFDQGRVVHTEAGRTVGLRRHPAEGEERRPVDLLHRAVRLAEVAELDRELAANAQPLVAVIASQSAAIEAQVEKAS